MEKLKGGDSVLFRRGDKFSGTLYITARGWDKADIVFAAYGDGSNPEFSGLKKISGWEKHQNYIWRAPCEECDTVASLLIDGAHQPLGRYPNVDDHWGGYLRIEAHRGNSEIIADTALKSTNWTGAEAVVRTRRWILDRSRVLHHNAKSFILSTPLTQEPIDGFGFFLQNHIATLDREGEWFYDIKSKQLFLYSTQDPAPKDIQASVQNKLISIYERNHITIENITLNGAATHAIEIRGGFHIRIKNLKLTNTGTNAVYGSYSYHIEILDNEIIRSNNNGIHLEYCNHVVVHSNTIKNIGLTAGMGKGGHFQYSAMGVTGKSHRVEQNVIENVGYLGIQFWSDGVIKNNKVSDFCMVKDDGGGIYTFTDINAVPDGYVPEEQLIQGNVIQNGKGKPEGTPYSNRFAAGVYLDDNSQNVTITGNVVMDCPHSGIYFRNSKEAKVERNTLINNGRQVSFLHDNTPDTFEPTGYELSDNVMMSLSPDQPLLYVSTSKGDIRRIGNFLNNQYYSLAENNKTFILEYYEQAKFHRNILSFNEWRNQFGKDSNSRVTSLNWQSFYIAFAGMPNLIGEMEMNAPLLWQCWSAGNDCIVRKDDLFPGMRIMTPSAGNNENEAVYIFAEPFPIKKNKKYVLYFSAKAQKPEVALTAILRDHNKPTMELHNKAFFSVDTTVRHYRYVFRVNEDNKAARLEFEMLKDAGSLWIGSIELREAEIEEWPAHNFLRVEYNLSDTIKRVTFDGHYTDLSGTAFGGDISIQPFSSLVLIKEDFVVPRDQKAVFNVIPEGTIRDYLSMHWYLIFLGLIIVAGVIFFRHRRVILMFGMLLLTACAAWGYYWYVHTDTIMLTNHAIVVNNTFVPLDSLNNVDLDIQGYSGQRLHSVKSDKTDGSENYLTIQFESGDISRVRFQIQNPEELYSISNILFCWKYHGYNVAVRSNIPWL